MADQPPSILIVEDEEGLADLYREWLDEFDVTTAYTAKEALQLVDESTDIALLDRRLPDGSGGAVLETIRDRGLDCRVAMVTAVDPDFDIIWMGFDAYVTKPVTQDDLLDVVQTLLARSDYDDRVDEYLSLLSKRVALERGKPVTELEASEEYRELEERIDSLSDEIDDLIAGFDEDDFRAAFLTLEGSAADRPTGA